MKKWTNWYLRGWEYQDVGVKRKLVYVGEYYTHGLPPRRLRFLKSTHFLIAALLLFVFFSFCSNGAAVGELIYIGMPVLLAQIPLIYYLIGIVCFLFVREKLTYRNYRASITRIRISAAISMVLFFISLVGQFVFHLAILSPDVLKEDLFYLAGTISCLLILGGQQYLLHRYPATVIPSGPAPLDSYELHQ